ncbi:hypothetical protein BO94DRAFT_620857 [Aspergillus sclerotioniger CBS 115572]|uniref:Uncharacterized protein n=1 Tax=Aspergillus sclerotioniger CBS 115572 TaxID=1450535 RepID=A0A317XA04_9EURO|nr:hypothetical protein BO94DRAFT_620857 [Aspergillus sclerotioniger CBS 115572]PWY95404.1 hypothetical protein BO94DRAFT_620857 [Aspergillus sclerotioniger CBS 115572]
MTSIFKRFYTIVGNVTLEHVQEINKNGAKWAASIDKVAKEEESVEARFTKLKIKGAKAHKSHKDPTDEQEVISLQFLDDNEVRIKSKHAHENGTSK